MDHRLQYRYLLKDHPILSREFGVPVEYSVMNGYQDPLRRRLPDDWIVKIHMKHTGIETYIRMDSEGRGSIASVAKGNRHRWWMDDARTAQPPEYLECKVDFLSESYETQNLAVEGGIMLSGKRFNCKQSRVAREEGDYNGFLIQPSQMQFAFILEMMCQSGAVKMSSYDHHGRWSRCFFVGVNGVSKALGLLIANGLFQVSDHCRRPPIDAVEEAAYLFDTPPDARFP